MNHIYIHIPFCIQKCSYCDFYSINDLSFIEQYTKTLIEEIKIYSKKYPETNITTIYLGGGTPSLIEPSQLEKTIKQLHTSFNINKNIEFTLEANPETFDQEKFIKYKNLGINRISLGVQSFDDQELKALGRIHNSQKAKDAITGISKIFDNFSIDLMYGFKNQAIKNLEKSIKTAINFQPKHISYYELTLEKASPPHPLSKTGEGELLNFYKLGKKILEKHNLKQYEISNYAIPGFESQHNLAYWSDKSYLGFGPGAHSYDKEKQLRWNNYSDLKKYLNHDFIENEEPAKPIDIIMMGLRKNEGIEKSFFENNYPEITKKLIDQNLLQEIDNKITFTEPGRVVANQVFLEFM